MKLLEGWERWQANGPEEIVQQLLLWDPSEMRHETIEITEDLGELREAGQKHQAVQDGRAGSLESRQRAKDMRAQKVRARAESLRADCPNLEPKALLGIIRDELKESWGQEFSARMEYLLEEYPERGPEDLRPLVAKDLKNSGFFVVSERTVRRYLSDSK